MSFDAHKNLAVSLVATAPSPATSGTSLVVTAGQGARFPAVPFNAAIWPIAAQPTPLNAEIVRVTAISTDTLTISRAQEGTTARTVVVGDQIAATITAKTITDIETLIGTRAAPATTGALQMDNAQWLTARNAANSADLNLLRANASNQAEITPELNLLAGAVVKGPVPWIDVRAYGAVGDGTTDDSAAIQAAINAAPANGANIFFPPLTFRVNTGLTVLDVRNVKLIGSGAVHHNYSASPTQGTRLRWGGSAGGTLLTVGCTTAQTDAYPSSGCGVFRMTLDGYSGTNEVATVLKVQSQWHGEFRDLHIRDGSSISFDVTTVNMTGTNPEDTQGCLFEHITISKFVTATGTAMRCHGSVPTGGDIGLCTFKDILIYHTNGVGLQVGSSDSNTFIGISVNRGAGGTGIGVELLAAASGGRSCSENTFFMLQAGPGGLTARSDVVPSSKNVIYGYLTDNGAPTPVVESGATLTWTTSSGDMYNPRLPNNQWLLGRNAAGNANQNLWRINASNWLEFGTNIYRDDNGSGTTDLKSWLTLIRDFQVAPVGRNSVSYLRYAGKGATSINDGHAGLLITGLDQSGNNLVISNATNATPIQITTTAAHGLTTGDPVNVTTVAGNTAANGNWFVTVVDATHVTLQGSVGNGAYTGGGNMQLAQVRNLTVTAATAASPIQITTATVHGFANGDWVQVYNGTGLTGLNGRWQIQVVNTTQFTLTGSTGTGTYNASTATVTNRGALYGIQVNVTPFADRGGLSGAQTAADDVTGYWLWNGGTGKATDGYFLGHNIDFEGRSEWVACMTLGANADFGLRMTGRIVSVGLDLGSVTIVPGAIGLLLPNAAPISGRNAANNANVSLLQINSLNELQIDAKTRFQPSTTNTSALVLGPTITVSSSFIPGLQCVPSFMPTSAGLSQMYGMQFIPAIVSTGGTSNAITGPVHGIFARVDLGASYTATMTEAHGINLANPSVNGGSGVITTYIGLNIDALTTAATNWGIFSAGTATKSQHNGCFGFGGDPGTAQQVLSALGTITADKQALGITGTWNSSGVTFTAQKTNITDTASAGQSLLVDLQVGGASKFSVDKLGNVATQHVDTQHQYMNFYDRVTNGAATLQTIAALARTVTSAVAATNQKDVRGEWLRISATASNADSSLAPSNFTQTQVGWDPIFVTKIQIPTAIVNMRVFVGLFSAAPVMSTDTQSTITCCAFRFSTGASDTTWRCISSNSSATQNVDSGVTVAANTVYLLKIDLTDNNNPRFYINGALVATVTTNPPGTSQTFGPGHYLRSLSASGQKDLDTEFSAIWAN